MPQVIFAEPSDEVADLIERVRSSADSDIAVVLPDGTRASQVPVNLRLLSQMGRSLGKKISVISGEPRVQELAKAAGFPTFASVPAFERGIETVRPHAEVVGRGAALMENGGSAGVAGGSGAVAVASPPAPAASRPVPPVPAAPVKRSAGGQKPNRRPRYLAFSIIGVVALIVFMILAPTARVTITLAGTRLTVKPEIQGSVDSAAGTIPDHLKTTLLTSSKTQSFQANPSGSKQVAGTAATGTIEYFSDTSFPVYLAIPQGAQFQTASGLTFEASATTKICIGNDTSVTAKCPSDYLPANNEVPVVDSTGEAAGNVQAGQITVLPDGSNPCASPGAPCSPKDISINNPAPTTGGADATTQVVASEEDVANWTQQVQTIESQLKTQVAHDMQTQVGAGNTLANDSNGNGISIKAEIDPPLPKANDPFNATNVVVTVHATGVSYATADLHKIIQADMQAQVPQGAQLAPNSIQVANQYINSVGADGSLDMTVQGVGYAQPTVNLQTLKDQIAGKSAGDVQRIVRGKVDHVQSVDVSQSLPWFWLPLFSSRIEIDENFVQQQ